METVETNIPRYMTIKAIAKTGILPEHCIRQMLKDGTLPTRVIKAGNKALLNYDLLVSNLSKAE